jgi:hypothetical protein
MKFLRVRAKYTLRREESERARIQRRASDRVNRSRRPSNRSRDYFVATNTVVGGGTGISDTLRNPAALSQFRYS